MKHLLKLLLVLVFFPVFVFAVPRIEFEINRLESDGKLEIVNYGHRNFTAYYNVIREFDESVDLTIKIYYEAAGSGTSIKLAERRITTQDFAEGFFYRMLSECYLPANLSDYNGGIYLKYVNNKVDNSVNTLSTWFPVKLNLSKYVDPAHLPKIESLGFSTSGITSFNDKYYLVEGDILVEKNSLSNNNFSNIVSGKFDHNINISMDETVWSNASLKYGLYDALRVWNFYSNSNIKLNLIDLDHGHYDVTPRVDVYIQADNNALSASTAMVAAYPYGTENPGGLILINSDFAQNSEQATWNFIHAIGHTLGLKHAINNSSSIMNRGNFLKSYPSSLNYTFPTDYDRNMIASMYPINHGGAVNPSIRGYNSVFNLSYISEETGLSYKWKVIGHSGTNYFYEETGGSFLTDLYLSKGNYNIECTISGGKYSAPVKVQKGLLIK